jgi:hypothetical protein
MGKKVATSSSSCLSLSSSDESGTGTALKYTTLDGSAASNWDTAEVAEASFLNPFVDKAPVSFPLGLACEVLSRLEKLSHGSSIQVMQCIPQRILLQHCRVSSTWLRGAFFERGRRRSRLRFLGHWRVHGQFNPSSGSQRFLVFLRLGKYTLL